MGRVLSSLESQARAFAARRLESVCSDLARIESPTRGARPVIRVGPLDVPWEHPAVRP